MAIRLGQWATVYPNTPVFIPEHRCVHVQPGCVLLPVVGHASMCAVMSPMDTHGARACVGWALVDIAPMCMPIAPPIRTHALVRAWRTVYPYVAKWCAVGTSGCMWLTQ